MTKFQVNDLVRIIAEDVEHGKFEDGLSVGQIRKCISSGEFGIIVQSENGTGFLFYSEVELYYRPKTEATNDEI